MHCSSILSVLYAAGTLAGPVLNLRNVGPHRHHHMDAHLHKGRDNGADAMLSWLEGNAPSGDFPPAGATVPSPSPIPVSNPQPEEKMAVAPPVVVKTITEGAPAPSSSSSSAPSAPSTAAPHPPPEIKEKISGPALAQNNPAPAQNSPSASPSASPSSAPTGGDMPSAPTQYEADMTSDDQAYKDLVLVHHNIHRANHSVPLLSWNDTLYETAKQSAQTCHYAHTSPIPPYGQNIAAGNAPGNVSADITNGFYNGEIGLFQQAIGEFGNSSPDMSDFEHWGHATQMLWKETTSVGCYTAVCSPPGADPEACNPGNGQSYLPPLNCLSGPGVVPTKAYFLVCDYYPPGNYPNSYNSVLAPNGEKPFVEMTANGVTGL